MAEWISCAHTRHIPALYAENCMAETNALFPTAAELRNRGEIYMESQSQIGRLIAGRLIYLL